MIECVRFQVDSQVFGQVYSQMWRGALVDKRVLRSSWDQVWRRVERQVQAIKVQVDFHSFMNRPSQVRTQVYAQVWDQIYSTVHPQVRSTQVWGQVYNQVWFQVRPRVDE